MPSKEQWINLVLEIAKFVKAKEEAMGQEAESEEKFICSFYNTRD